MKRTRKSYSPNFKVKMVLELLRESKTMAEIASESGVHPTQLHRWRKEFLEKLPNVFAEETSWAAEKMEYEQKIERLYSELGKTSVELAWLKKKMQHVEPV